MKKIFIYILFAFLMGLVLGYLFQSIQQEKQEVAKNDVESTRSVTKSNCLADDCLLNGTEYPVSELPDDVVSALNKALMDEYKAYATYQAVMERFGVVRPFVMIARAEQMHISSLEGIYEKYGVDIPQNIYLNMVSVPESVKASCALGVQAEIENVELYKESLIPVVKDYEDISIIFTNLMNASEYKHLPAFQRCD